MPAIAPSSSRPRTQGQAAPAKLSRVRVSPAKTAASDHVIKPDLTARRHRSHWVDAGRWLTSIFISAFGSVAVAWLAAYTMSHGFIFSGRSPAYQSRTLFLTSALLWVHVFFCFSACVLQSVSLFRLHLHTRPDRPAGICYMVTRMVRRTLPWFLISGLLNAGVAQLCGRYIPVSWRKFKPEMYISSSIYYSYFAAADLAARCIYRTETVEGAAGQRRVSRPGASHTLRRGARVSATNIPLLMALIVPLIFVHVISVSIEVLATVPAIWLIMGSLGFKLLVQEATKHYIIKNRIANPRTMAALVCLPTVLVDTQVRMLFMRFQSPQGTLTSTLLLACLEVALRVAKSFVLKKKLHPRFPTGAQIVPVNQLGSRHCVGDDRTASSSASFTLKSQRAQLLRHSIIELSSAMFAEYVAIGCSGAMIVFFAPNPEYLLGSSLTQSFGKSLKALGLQVVVELIVDYVSCVVELRNGNDVVYFDYDRGFLVVFFAFITLLNINASAVLYLAN